MIISAACGVPMCYTWVSYANQRDGSFGLLWTNPDVDVLSFESFFVSLHCWNGFGG